MNRLETFITVGSIYNVNRLHLMRQIRFKESQKKIKKELEKIGCKTLL